MLEINSLSKKFGCKYAVETLSFNLKRGEIMGFIGPNGAGKSTTMRMITGYLSPTTGTVIVNGINMAESPLPAKTHIGYLPENAPLYGNMTVLEFLSFAAELRGYRGREKRRRVDEYIGRCFLESVRHQTIDTLSKGYRQRTCFAQAIIHEPGLLVLDEPTDGLDPNQKDEVRKLIKEMGRERAIIVSTHILEEVEAVTDRVLLISRGRKMFDGTPGEFRALAADNGTVILEISEHPAAELADIVRELPEADKVEVFTDEDGASRLRIYPAEKIDGKELRRSVAVLCHNKNWTVVELAAGHCSLNKVFADLTLKRVDEPL